MGLATRMRTVKLRYVHVISKDLNIELETEVIVEDEVQQIDEAAQTAHYVLMQMMAAIAALGEDA